MLKNVPVTTIVIPSRAIEQSQAGNLKDLLTYEFPSIHFQNNGGYDNTNMLGFDAKYILFLIDGERMSGKTFNNLDYNRINLNNVERIEIVKGSLIGNNLPVRGPILDRPRFQRFNDSLNLKCNV
ncbi:Plug domain-containing protein [uncultured Proteiniphilum sp.]|uniref:Plug domain-containing protein n=1 Tax=uncultured Proteiniphilum sp. TaxID=497637 RepID=UPI00262B065A|nr:Plug domain-containing protein [uncultured Proteiniphilum sp.]